MNRETEAPEPEPDYDEVYPIIVRRLRRLCNECGWNNVLNVFSNDMPEHRRERAQHERREREERRRKHEERRLRAATTSEFR